MNLDNISNLLLVELANHSPNDWVSVRELSSALGKENKIIIDNLYKLSDAKFIELDGTTSTDLVARVIEKGRTLVRSDQENDELASEKLKEPSQTIKYYPTYRENWLRANYLRLDPFMFSDANYDKNLWLYFVEKNFLPEILGDPEKPTTCFVFGDEGIGKSSLRLMVEKYASAFSCLSVTATDFSQLRGVQDISLDSIIEYLITAVVKSFFSSLKQQKSSSIPAQIGTKDCNLFWTYCDRYRSKDINIAQLGKILGCEPVISRLPKNRINRLFDFCNLVRSIFGYKSIYFLVDANMVHFQEDRDSLWKILKPLISSSVVNEAADQKIAFKYFLNIEYEEKAHKIFWIKSRWTARVYRIGLWPDDDLQGLIRKRLEECSFGKRSLKSLAELADESLGNLDELVLKAAAGHPRVLVELVEKVISIHCNRLPDDPIEQISEEEYNTAAEEFHAQQELEIRNMISQGKTSTLEIKPRLLYEKSTEQIADVKEREFVQDISAFMNAAGGTILIGIEDNGDPVGIESDISTLKKEHQAIEGFDNQLFGMVERLLGSTHWSKLNIHHKSFRGKQICWVTIQMSDTPIFFDAGSEFFVRIGNITMKLNASEQYEYINQHFK